jgi:hypothetical protein
MASQSQALKIATPADSDESPDDLALRGLRFRALLSVSDWERLPLATRRRFSKRLADGHTAVYVGEVIEVSFSQIGWWVAQIAGLIGGPLRIPAALLHLAAGDFADEMLLGGQRVVPNKALSSGFVFRHETLRSAFEAIL